MSKIFNDYYSSVSYLKNLLDFLETQDLSEMTGIEDVFDDTFFKNYNKVFCNVILVNCEQILSPSELELFNNSNFDSKLDVFKPRTKENIVRFRENSPPSFQYLSGYINLFKCWVLFDQENSCLVFHAPIVFSLKALKNSINLLLDDKICLESRLTETLEIYNKQLLFFLEFLSLRSILVNLYLELTNFIVFKFCLLRLILSLDYYLFKFLEKLFLFLENYLTILKKHY